MRKNIQKHMWHYLVYFAIFGGGLLLVIATRNSASLQSLLVIMIAFLYFLWAMVHHYVNHELHPRVVVEYILIIMLGIFLTLFLFQG